MRLLSNLQKYGIGVAGATIPNLMIHGKPAPYPVVNERAVRAGAGMLFALGFFFIFPSLLFT